MNWINDFVRPKIKALVQAPDISEQKSWYKCPRSGEMVFHRELENNLWVFPSGHHARLPVEERFKMLFDDAAYETLPFVAVKKDPLNFKDLKRYKDRLKDNQGKEENRDALCTAFGLVGGYKTVIGVFDFSFMGGSMGVAVGEAFLQAAEQAVQQRAALVIVTASGGARMQEGALSLMQLARTTIAVQMVKEAGLPYVVILADPTTGGVSASFAMIGDVHIAEAGATIGFAGKRVIQQTVGEELPDDFQTSEYLREHGMVDIVTTRHKLKENLSGVLSYLHPTARAAAFVRSIETDTQKVKKLNPANKAANNTNSASHTELPKAAE